MPNSADNRKRRERRQRASQRRNNRGAEECSAHFSEWQIEGERWINEVRQALNARPLDLTYRKQKDRPPSTLTLAEIAVVLLAVEGFGMSKRGISYRRIRLAYKMTSQGFQRSKVAAAFRVLLGLGMIEQVGGHSQGHRGRQYRRVF